MTVSAIRIVSIAIVLFGPTALFASEQRGDQPTFVAVGGTFGQPLRLAGRIGIIVPTSHPLKGTPPDFVAQASAGLGGWEVSTGFRGCCVGPGLWFGGEGPSEGIGTLGIRASFIRTWRSPKGTVAGESLFGGVVEYTIYHAVTVDIGLHQPIGRSANGKMLFTWNVGFGVPLRVGGRDR